MNRIPRRLAALGFPGLLALVVISPSPAGAIDQDLVVSATSAAPGAVVDVSSASCVQSGGPDAPAERYLRVLLISGTGNSALLAGAGSGDGSVSLIVPDWLDPDMPAAIEASCVTVDFESGDFAETAEPFDPVVFDVLPGAGSPTQTRTFSRTELLAGQSFAVSGTGCASGDDTFAGVDLVSGGDLSGRSLDDLVTSGGGVVDGGSFDVQVDLIDRTWGYGWSSSDGGRPENIQIDEFPTEIPAGPYTAISYCGTYDEASDTAVYLMLTPQLIEVTGDAPFADVTLDVKTDTRDATMAGGSCTTGDVEGAIGGRDLVAESEEEFDRVRVADHSGVPSPLRPAFNQSSGAPARAVGHDEWVPFTAAPDSNGSWSIDETATFEVGVLVGEATCGDPLGDGFLYDLRLAVVDVPPAPPTTVPTAPTSAPSNAAPADPISGTPAYAG